MPDVKGKVTSAFVSGNKAMLEVTWEGTQSGPPGGPKSGQTWGRIRLGSPYVEA